jgi:hypothetical protein
MSKLETTSVSISERKIGATTVPAEPRQPESRFTRLRKEGWRFTVKTHVYAAMTVLVLNLIFLIVGEVQYNKTHPKSSSTDRIRTPQEMDGQRVLHTGKCNIVKRLNIVAHLLINLSSTILLAASNFCMQCMSAPTREEIDKAHAQSKWLDIGILSMRNLLNIDKKRVFLWFVLAFSSIPLHLL